MTPARISRRTLTAGVAATPLVAMAATGPARARELHGGHPARYADVLDLHGTPSRAEPAEVFDINVFSDQGAWHAYALPSVGDTDAYGGFTGPLYIAQEYPWWLSRTFTRITLRDHRSGRAIRLGEDRDPTVRSLPGRLEQRFRTDDLQVELDLCFVSNRTALVRAHIQNRSAHPRRLQVSWSGALLRPEQEPMRSAPSLRAGSHGIAVEFARVRQTWDYLTGGDECFAVRHSAPSTTTVRGDSYATELNDALTIPAREHRSLCWTETFTFTVGERRAEDAVVTAALAHPDRTAMHIRHRWDGLVDRATHRRPRDRRALAVKAAETLCTDWRSPAGRLSSDGITPSISYKWFTGGFWSWDSWKEAVGLVDLDPDLARSTIRSVFDHQITEASPTRPQDAGMVPDAVFYNDPSTGGGNWNERNTKPPLASWATWRVYRSTGDRSSLRDMYPRLLAFHRWWHTNRDHDGRGVCEYGATVDPANDSPEQRLLAAAWESGMDNAPRFDASAGAAMLENRDENGRLIGWSLNQASVDLNSYLVADARYLALMARVLGRHHEARELGREADRRADVIRTHMYDEATGWFYDMGLDDRAPLVERGMGIEGAIPLWAGVATRDQAAAVREHLMSPDDFATPVPIPTVARSSPHFSPTKYWRGPVWLDQATFAIHGLRRYRYHHDADAVTRRLLSHAEGLLGDTPIAENYNPLTGEAMNSTNFAWSAAMVLLLTDAHRRHW